MHDLFLVLTVMGSSVQITMRTTPGAQISESMMALDASLYTRLEPIVTNKLRQICRDIEQERKNGTKPAATNTRADQHSDSD